MTPAERFAVGAVGAYAVLVLLVFGAAELHIRTRQRRAHARYLAALRHRNAHAQRAASWSER